MFPNIVITIVFLLGLILSISSCKKDIEAVVPAYIKVDHLNLHAEDDEGASIHQFSDIWVNCDGSRIGTYGIPAKFPVVNIGEHTLTFYPGITKNGIIDLKEVYPFIEPLDVDIDLVEDSIHTLNLTFNYKEETKFYIEDFESPGEILHTDDTINYLDKIVDPNDENNHIGKIIVPDTVSFFSLYTNVAFKRGYTPIYLEFDYKGDNFIAIGIKALQSSGYYKYNDPYIVIKPTQTWNRIYTNIVEQMYNTSGGESYDVYFLFYSEDGEVSEFSLDNMKLLYY
ncbi:MAG: hypothetical protein JXR60_04635 [Bacteroidales bacterium]|nr:hypothetical protein [Bacteroidales bacterium]